MYQVSDTYLTMAFVTSGHDLCNWALWHMPALPALQEAEATQDSLSPAAQGEPGNTVKP